MKLTLRQQQVYDFIAAAVGDGGLPPTRAEIARKFGFKSINASEQHLRALARKGVIDLMAGTSRGIRIKKASGLPVVGQVVPGTPLLAAENQQGSRPVNGAMFSPKADFLLRASGVAMRDAGIVDGDLLAVHATAQVRDGDVVVARLNGELLVRRLRRKAGKVTLEAAAAEPAAIEVDSRRQDFSIEGLVVGLIRSFD
ncbi:MAG TPA: LexA repressor [Gammaproteobacteria bacterium]|uniref:transcriptional repressor LexA n=1 Tax=Immundisolibacter sp. TaxID=1934948 RepID=UPI000E8266EB|nr:LexA repressor [Gammaproteobacteria bacterium]HCZ49128.1 LexA repressor [Gammaproteobacteria bacterium]MCH78566.1 LexA repressor [Gammaproteobacteria bacterium]